MSFIAGVLADSKLNRSLVAFSLKWWGLDPGMMVPVDSTEKREKRERRRERREERFRGSLGPLSLWWTLLVTSF